nr:isoform 2 of methylmalonate-semialdehyde dehydrogenase [acylating], mitochondrial [Quercus suber]
MAAIYLICWSECVVEVYENWLAECCLQSNVGAKNHAVVMPDAGVDATSNALLAAGFGAAGQKCMALSTVVLRKFDRQGSKQGNFPLLEYLCNMLVELYKNWLLRQDAV